MKSSNSWIEFIKSTYFLKNLGMVVGMILAFLIVVNFLLKQFTRHGEAIQIPDFIGEYVETSQPIAKKMNLKLMAVDSVFIVGKPGGQIINQTPQPGSKIKKGRIVYLTITKSKADEIAASRLPVLYGKSYERKSRELKNGFEISSRIVDYKYDSGPENYILAVLYKGDTIVSSRVRNMDVMIEKGGMLDMIVSKSSGGQIEMPNLICKTYSEAAFLARSLNILLDPQSPTGVNISEYYISSQDPDFFPGAKMLMGDTLRVNLSSDKPSHCDW